MYKKLSIFTFFLLSIFISFVAADDYNYYGENDVYQDENVNKSDEEVLNHTYKANYVRLGLLGIPGNNNYVPAPTLALGWLFKEKDTGIDYSINYAMIEHHHKTVISFLAPKMMYMRFFNTQLNHNFYAGLGGGLGGFLTNNTKFLGLVTSAAVGYSIRSSKQLNNYLHFIYLGIGMPTLPVIRKGDVFKPMFEFSAGIGY